MNPEISPYQDPLPIDIPEKNNLRGTQEEELPSFSKIDFEDFRADPLGTVTDPTQEELLVHAIDLFSESKRIYDSRHQKRIHQKTRDARHEESNRLLEEAEKITSYLFDIMPKNEENYTPEDINEQKTYVRHFFENNGKEIKKKLEERSSPSVNKPDPKPWEGLSPADRAARDY